MAPLAATKLVHLSAYGAVALSFGLLVGLIATPVLFIRVLSGRHRFLELHEPPRSWPWSPPLWRGYVRALLVLPVGWDLAVCGVLAGAFTPRHSASAAIAYTLYVLACVAFALAVSLVLLARPKRLIPPALRDQPGALSEWRLARRQRAHRHA